MSDDATTVLDGLIELVDKIKVERAKLATEVTTEWAVRWTADDGGDEYEDHPTREAAVSVAHRHHGELVARTVSRSRWTAAVTS